MPGWVACECLLATLVQTIGYCSSVVTFSSPCRNSIVGLEISGSFLILPKPLAMLAAFSCLGGLSPAKLYATFPCERQASAKWLETSVKQAAREPGGKQREVHGDSSGREEHSEV